jgi:hypothetical protein
MDSLQYGAVGPVAGSRPPAVSWVRRLAYGAAGSVAACGLIALLALTSSSIESPGSRAAEQAKAVLRVKHDAKMSQLQLHLDKTAPKAAAATKAPTTSLDGGGGENWAMACGTVGNAACPASQSSTYLQDVAELALDGGTTANYDDGSCTHTNDSDNPWCVCVCVCMCVWLILHQISCYLLLMLYDNNISIYNHDLHSQHLHTHTPHKYTHT